MALADLVEKGADTDLLRQMIEEVVERVMAFDVADLCYAGYGERSDERDYAGFEIQPTRSTIKTRRPDARIGTGCYTLRRLATRGPVSLEAISALDRELRPEYGWWAQLVSATPLAHNCRRERLTRARHHSLTS
jgi:hypothetical protein